MSIDTLIRAHNKGDAAATSQLLKHLYAELHRIARRKLSAERKGHTLQTTELVGEAYLRLFQKPTIVINDKNHFLSLAAETMRRILIDHARRKRRRVGGAGYVTLDDSWVAGSDSPVDYAALGEALSEQQESYPREVRVIDLRFFVGFSVVETAELLSVSEETIKNDTHHAKAWLYRRMALLPPNNGRRTPSTGR